MGDMMENNEKEDIKFYGTNMRKILEKENLHIPDYQRPYKWQRRHICNLFYDIKEAEAMKKDSYHIGSLILHDTGDHIDIVDGQQQTISIALFLHALGRLNDYKGAESLLNQHFSSISGQHARENYEEWQQLIQLLGEVKAKEISDFLLDNCQVSVIKMSGDRLAEAFQLFDSQNSRGKSLEPHDLLKAYHLREAYHSRETSESDEMIEASNPKENLISHWEEAVNDDLLTLKDLFDQHLFRIRHWSRGDTGLTKRKGSSYLRFTEKDIDDFKGVDLTTGKDYPYLKLYNILSENGLAFPNSLTMPIINGRAFFDFVKDSHKKIKKLKSQLAMLDADSELGQVLSELPQIFSVLQRKNGRYVKVRNLFDNLLALFIDRFGEEEVTKEIVELIFVWAYYLRVEMPRVYDASLANYAAGGKLKRQEVQKLFQLLSHAVSPQDFIMRVDRDMFENKTVDEIIEGLEKKK